MFHLIFVCDQASHRWPKLSELYLVLVLIGLATYMPPHVVACVVNHDFGAIRPMTTGAYRRVDRVPYRGIPILTDMWKWYWPGWIDSCSLEIVESSCIDRFKFQESYNIPNLLIGENRSIIGHLVTNCGICVGIICRQICINGAPSSWSLHSVKDFLGSLTGGKRN